MSEQYSKPLWYKAKLGDKVVDGIWYPDIYGLSLPSYNPKQELIAFIIKNHNGSPTSPIDLLEVEPIVEGKWYISGNFLFTLKHNGSFKHGWPVYVNDLTITIADLLEMNKSRRSQNLSTKIHQYLNGE